MGDDNGTERNVFFLGMKFLLNYSPNKKQFLFLQLGASQLQILDMKQQAKTPVNQITGFIYYKNIEDNWYNQDILQQQYFSRQKTQILGPKYHY